MVSIRSHCLQAARPCDALHALLCVNPLKVVRTCDVRCVVRFRSPHHGDPEARRNAFGHRLPAPAMATPAPIPIDPQSDGEDHTHAHRPTRSPSLLRPTHAPCLTLLCSAAASVCVLCLSVPLSPGSDACSPIPIESAVSNVSDAAPNPLSPTPIATAVSPMQTQHTNGVSSTPLHSSDSPAHSITPASSNSHHPVPHPSAEQVAQETLDARTGHAHDKHPSVIAAEGAQTHLPDVNATAPWVAEGTAVNGAARDPHIQRAPAPMPTHGSALPPLDEKLAQANASAASIHEQAAASAASEQAAASSSSSSASSPAPAAAAADPSHGSNGVASASAVAASAVAASSASSTAAPADASSSMPEVSRAVDESSNNPPSRRPSAMQQRALDAVRVDRWGNIRRDEVQEPPTPEERARAAAARRKQLLLDQERESKWVKMVANWDRTMRKRSEKIKRRIRKGLPDSMRAAVWPRFTGAWDLMRQVPAASSSGGLPKTGPGVYQRYAGMYSKEQDTIQRDIARTFPNHVLFRDSNPDNDSSRSGAGQAKSKAEDLEGKGSSGRSALYNVLKAYSLHDEQVGYCQGMGFPAGLFLMYMSEEESFWMLHCIARGEKYLLNGLWSPGFPLLFQCFSQYAALLAKHCPKLSAHLLSQEQPIIPELYATHWFMTLFSYNLPFEVVLRIWDILLAEGPKIIFRLAIFFMKHMEPALLAEKDFAGILDILKNLHKDPIMQDPDAIIEGAMRVSDTTPTRDTHAHAYFISHTLTTPLRSALLLSLRLPCSSAFPLVIACLISPLTWCFGLRLCLCVQVAISRAELSKLADKFQAQKFHEEQAAQKQQQQNKGGRK